MPCKICWDILKTYIDLNIYSSFSFSLVCILHPNLQKYYINIELTISIVCRVTIYKIRYAISNICLT